MPTWKESNSLSYIATGKKNDKVDQYIKDKARNFITGTESGGCAVVVVMCLAVVVVLAGAGIGVAVSI